MAYDGMYMAPSPGYANYEDTANQISEGISGLADAQQAAYGARMAEFDATFKSQALLRQGDLDMQKFLLDAAKQRKADDDASAAHLLEVEKLRMDKEKHDLSILETRERLAALSEQRAAVSALSIPYSEAMAATNIGEIWLRKNQLEVGGLHKLPQDMRTNISDKVKLAGAARVLVGSVERSFETISADLRSDLPVPRRTALATYLKSGASEDLIKELSPGYSYSPTDWEEARAMAGKPGAISIYDATEASAIAAARTTLNQSVAYQRMSAGSNPVAKQNGDEWLLANAGQVEEARRVLSGYGITINPATNEPDEPEVDTGARVLTIFSRYSDPKNLSPEFSAQTQKYFEHLQMLGGDRSKLNARQLGDLDKLYPANPDAVAAVRDRMGPLSSAYNLAKSRGDLVEARRISKEITSGLLEVSPLFLQNRDRVPSPDDFTEPGAAEYAYNAQLADDANSKMIEVAAQRAALEERPVASPSFGMMQVALPPGTSSVFLGSRGRLMSASDVAAGFNEALSDSESGPKVKLGPSDARLLRSIQEGAVVGLVSKQGSNGPVVLTSDTPPSSVSIWNGNVVLQSPLDQGPVAVPDAMANRGLIRFRDAVATVDSYWARQDGANTRLASDLPKATVAKSDYSRVSRDPLNSWWLASTLSDVVQAGGAVPPDRGNPGRRKGPTYAPFSDIEDWAQKTASGKVVARGFPFGAADISAPNTAPVLMPLLGVRDGGSASGVSRVSRAIKEANDAFAKNGGKSDVAVADAFVEAFGWDRAYFQEGAKLGYLAKKSSYLPVSERMLSDAPWFREAAKKLLDEASAANPAPDSLSARIAKRLGDEGLDVPAFIQYLQYVSGAGPVTEADKKEAARLLGGVPKSRDPGTL